MTGAASSSGSGGDEEEEIRVGWRMAGLGMEVASEVAAGAALGWLWDRWRGSGPTGLLVGSIVGIVVGLWTMIRKSLKLTRELEAKHPTAGRGKPLRDEDNGKPGDDWNEDERSQD